MEAMVELTLSLPRALAALLLCINSKTQILLHYQPFSVLFRITRTLLSATTAAPTAAARYGRRIMRIGPVTFTSVITDTVTRVTLVNFMNIH